MCELLPIGPYYDDVNIICGGDTSNNSINAKKLLPVVILVNRASRFHITHSLKII